MSSEANVLYWLCCVEPQLITEDDFTDKHESTFSINKECNRQQNSVDTR